MNNKIKILFVSQHVVHDATFQAGHKSFGYYLSQFCNDDTFEVGFLVDHHNDASFQKMKSQYGNTRDFSVNTPWLFKLLKYFFYYRLPRYFFSILNPTWIYISPIRSILYKKALRNIKQSGWAPDVICFEWTEMIFLQYYCRKLFDNALLMATEHDVSFNKLYRQYDKNLYFKLFLLDRFKNAELKALKAMDCVIVLSSNDQALLEKNAVNPSKILLIAPFYNRINRAQQALKKEVIFYGAMNRPENMDAVTWFLDNVYIPYKLDLIVSFTVIGSGLPDHFKRKYAEVRNLNFTGFVERPEDYFSTALCMVVPLTYGGGIKIKVLEAMSASVAVLTNDIGIEGIKATPGLNYLRCLEPEDYFNAITELSKNSSLARTFGDAGRLMMESNYNFDESYDDYKCKIINLYQRKNDYA